MSAPRLPYSIRRRLPHRTIQVEPMLHHSGAPYHADGVPVYDVTTTWWIGSRRLGSRTTTANV